jgi:hypothetical protein
MNQRGFANLTLYAAIGAGVVILGMSIALKVQSSRLGTVKREYAAFQAQVAALGEIAEQKARAREKQDKELKARIDNEHKKTVATLRAESDRLRNARSSVSFLPQPSGTAPSPTVTADRAKLESALRDFDTAVTGLVDEGDQSIAQLNAAKSWASQVK